MHCSSRLGRRASRGLWASSAALLCVSVAMASSAPIVDLDSDPTLQFESDATTSLVGPPLSREALISASNDAFGLAASDVVRIRAEGDVESRHLILPLVIEGLPTMVSLEPHSVRGDNYRLLVQTRSGMLVEVPAGPERNVRGELLGMPGSIVSGALQEDGLHLRIARGDGTVHWLQPIGGRVEGSHGDDHVLYNEADLLPTDRTCGTHDLPDALDHRLFLPTDSDGRASGGASDGGLASLKIAELACDADFEYFQAWGSVANVESRINAIVNTVNVQYESQVGISHALTTIIVRTSSSQPYTSSDAQTLLNQFRNQWNANHGNISRDVAHLFTGKTLNGSTIGIAWVGVICNLSYAYGLSQSDFNGNYACATDLTAHELGHNWNALHCSCASHTMNPSITCANNFNPTFTIPTIIQFRDSRPCLDDGGDPDPDVGACCYDGACFTTSEGDCIAIGGSWLGVGTSCADADCGCPSGQIKDCNGNCAPASWVGDGFCDDGSYTFNGVAIFFDCEEFNCDGGDCVCEGDPDPEGDVINLATADFATAYGTITGGSYLSTHALNGQYQSIREQHTGGPPPQRISILDHTWTFNVAAGSAHVFGVSAYHTPNSEGDNFVFSYSLNNSTWTPMVTVTKTSPNGAYQTYVFDAPISGTVYVRVQDTDQTPGNRQEDTIYIDSMYILSVDGDDPVVPPSAPTNLSANAGDGSVSLSWTASSSTGVVGSIVARSTVNGGPYTALTASPIAGTTYLDVTVTNGVTYYYVVRAVDSDGLQSGDSNQASATPQGPTGDPTTMSVASITASAINLGGGDRQGRADVLIVDSNGSPVSGVTVSGTFTGRFNESGSAVTNSSGIATILTAATVKGNASFTFCVTNVTGGGLTYDADGNSVTCGSN